MIFNSRRAAALALAALLAACTTGVDFLDRPLGDIINSDAPRDQAPAAIPTERPQVAAPADPALAPVTPGAGQWPHQVSDLKPDPDIRFGALPNGMRYAIRRNATPSGQASLRLGFATGSMQETDAERGLAHFLEHMAFNGSTNIPEGQLIPTLQRAGLAFGPDSNASTSWNETLYQLDLPRADNDTLSLGLRLMRETASELSLAQAAVDREKGVVQAEARGRNTPSYRISIARTRFMLDGQRTADRFPIGEPAVIESATSAALRSYYERYYRPERATLVAVGDFNLDDMEARIRAGFSDWAGKGPAGADAAAGPIKARGATARVAVEAGVSPSLQIAWIQPPDHGVDTLARVRRDVIQNIGLSILNRRLTQLARAQAPPFIAASAGRSDYLRAAMVTSLGVSFEGAGWRKALEAVDQEQRRLLQHGVRQDEVDREVASWSAGFRASVAAAATRPTPALADELADSVETLTVVTSPAQDLELFEAIARELTVEQVNAGVRAAFRGGQGPLLFMATPTALDGGEAALLAAYAASQRTAVAAAAAPGALAWPYTSFGPPGQVSGRNEAVDLDADFISFANGVKLTFKPTKFRDDEVQVLVRIGRGVQSLPKTAQPLGWAEDVLISGGLSKISVEDMERVLASKVWNAYFGSDNDAYELSAVTTRDDLETQLQILAAYASEPGWRPEAFERQKTYALTQLDAMGSTAAGVIGRDLPGLMHPGDRRFAYPNRAEMAATTLDQVRAQITPGLTQGPVEIIIVGDVTIERAIELVSATFGALPSRPAADPPAGNLTTTFPEGGGPVVNLTHTGRADQGVIFVSWKTADFFSNPTRARTLSILGKVLEIRLQEELREREGAAYSPAAGSSASFVWPDWGQVSLSLDVAPDRIPAVLTVIDQIATELGQNPPSADELARAKAPVLEQIQRQRETNGYWASVLAGGQADPRRLDAVRSVQAALSRVTAAEVQQAARDYLAPGKAWRVVVRPR